MTLQKKPILNLISLAAITALVILPAQAQENTEPRGDAEAESTAAQNADTPNSIQSLSVSSSAGGKLVLKVGMKSAPPILPLNFTINTPPRIAFDFPNTENGAGKSMQEFGEGQLRSANIVQAGSRTRLVLNLNEMVGYDTRIQGNDLLITLQAKSADASASNATVRFAEAAPSLHKYAIRDIDFGRGKNGEGRVQIDLSDAGIGIDVKQQGDRRAHV